MKIIMIAVLILAISSPVAAEVYHEDTPKYRLERAKERLDDFKEMNWDWGSYSNSEGSGIKAGARELQRIGGHLSYRKAYGESVE
ncbi:MAG: hypothetical protein DSZ28_01500 [Thiothrix sp.]|nr:MAG: hypothetical protein DSZ28_01500 [Thiothrix sp.]